MGLLALFIAVMLISNVVVTKGVLLFPQLQFDLGPLQVRGIVTDGAFFLFPLAYVLGDVISEVYGFRTMRRVIMLGFGSLLLMTVCFWLTLQLPGAPFWDNQAALESVIGVVPQFVAAGLAGYLCGEFLNSFVLVKLKERTGERSLWARVLGSSVVGQAVDTTVFCAIAATGLGIATVSDFLNYVIVGFVWKLAVEAGLLPVTYGVTGWLKRAEPSYGKVTAPS
nr:queuosine precursor transporter [Naumannella cuiyingiana]